MDSKLSKLGRLIGIAEGWVDVVEFVSDGWLRERGSARGTFAEFWVDNPDDMKLGIFLDESLIVDEKLITLAHELGHARNFIDDFKRDSEHMKFLESSPSATRFCRLKGTHGYIRSTLLKMVDFEDWDEFLEAVDFSFFENLSWK